MNYGNTDIRIHNVSVKSKTNIAHICEMSSAYSTEHTVSSRLYLRHPQVTHKRIHYCIVRYIPRGYYNDGLTSHTVMKGGTEMQITTSITVILKNKRPTWCHLLFYFTSYVLNMFRTLIYPSSGACDYSVELPHCSSCSWFSLCWRFSVVELEWNPTTPNLQHKSNQEQDDQCGNSTE